MPHELTIRVYYEDTDLAGIVYYANYLRFIERARTEMVRAQGVDQSSLKEAEGIVFAVRKLTAEYLQPARFDDLLTVRTKVMAISGARVVLGQGVWRGDTELFRAEVTLVVLNDAGKPARIPAELRQKLGAG